MNEALDPGVAAATDASESSRVLATALRSPHCYPHPAPDVQVIETHISRVLLAGEFAYKIKKPVRFPFLDFSELKARRYFCDEELRLNRRTAPSLYLDVVAITGSSAAPAIGGSGAAIEYAVRMRRFAQEDLLDRRAREGRLRPEEVDSLAAVTANLHAGAIRPHANTPFGAPDVVLRQALDNFTALEGLENGPEARRQLEGLRAWVGREHDERVATFELRRREGCVRECHGDLHLGNVVLLDGIAVPFDCIEFDPGMRMIDVMNDIAFALMDLHHHDLPRLAARFLDGYLQITGDYAGLRVLRFYCVYRAMVRAKIAGLRAHQVALGDREALAADARSLQRHLALAQRFSLPERAGLMLMHGLSGSGKSTVAALLLECLDAIRLRSDVERKRLHGLAALAASGSAPGGGIYGQAQTRGTYERLLALAQDALAEGYPVIVDATFLKRAQREPFRALAASAGVPFAIVACEAPEAVLRRRLEIRARVRDDASEGDASVLAQQVEHHEPPAGDELGSTLAIDTTRDGATRELEDALLRRLQR